MNRLLAVGLGCLVMFSQQAQAEGIDGKPDAADGYTVIEVPSDHIERYVTPGTDADHLPKSIQGIWWMDGNPTGDILVTLAGSTWDAASRTAVLPVYGPGNYTFYPADDFKAGYLDMVRTHARFILQFSEDFTFATMAYKEDGTAPGDSGTSSESENVVYTMYLQEDGHWVRESWIAGIKIPDYQLRRIVTADGKHDPAYINYLLVAKPTSMIGYKYK